MNPIGQFFLKSGGYYVLGVYVLGGRLSVQGVGVRGVSDWGVCVLGVSVQGVSDWGVCVLGVSVRGLHVRGVGGGG